MADEYLNDVLKKKNKGYLDNIYIIDKWAQNLKLKNQFTCITEKYEIEETRKKSLGFQQAEVLIQYQLLKGMQTMTSSH